MPAAHICLAGKRAFVFCAPLSSPFNRHASVNTAILISLRSMEAHIREIGMTKNIVPSITPCWYLQQERCLLLEAGLVRCANGRGRTPLFEPALPKSHGICCENKRNPFLWFWMFHVSSSGFSLSGRTKSFLVLGCVGRPEMASCFKLYGSLKFRIQVMLKQVIFIYEEA